MLKKVLVANRGEIAIRAFRAAYELGIRTVAVYTPEDRSSMHRQKADEAYEIGEPGHPVRAYLDIEAIVGTAKRVGADAIYPGYGFLSESPALARACEEAGITFVGPPESVLKLTGDKTRARRAAEEAGVPVTKASEPVTDPEEAARQAKELGFPVFVKAASGGGGRGMRLVPRESDLKDAVAAATREAEAAFGDPTVFLEQAVVRPRHIEVQILADADGEVIHLFERDCSVQRRHQKVVELAPAPNLDPDLRDRLCEDAVKFARRVGYRNAGTVEFLLGEDGSHVFIEMNPRIQVEHTVTEETTDVDLVISQMRIAGGESLSDLGLSQEGIRQRGFALQCRVTTEDPANGFAPDTGRISAYRSPGGAGIRLDGGNTYSGAEVSPFFDSLLVKLTTRGNDLPSAARRARRALAEFRIRGVATNVAFLRAVLSDKDFLAGRLDTSFIDDRPHLTAATTGKDRATRLLSLLADVTVNRPHGEPPDTPDPREKLPPLAERSGAPEGSKQRLERLGPEGFARDLRETHALRVTDTTMRDAHQSLFATRMRTFDMLSVAPYVSRTMPELFSAEVWGGATFDVALRFLHEDPWSRLERLRESMPNICLQMLLRGRNALGYTAYPDDVVEAFVKEAHAAGVDIFRIFDANNDIDQMRPAIRAAVEAGAVAEGTLCYSGNLVDQGEKLYTLDYYLELAEKLVAAGSHILCIKDMAGLVRAPAARRLVGALRERFDLPVHFHTHDTGGGQLASYLAAIEAGVDAIDGAAAPMSGMTSQPSLAAIVAATDGTDRESGISLDALGDLEPYWEAVRSLYAPFEAGLRSPTGTVYRHEIPGGQLSNLRQQAVSMGLAERFEEVELLYARCDAILGRIVKVTPTSKVVGDLALYLLSAGIDPDEFEENPSKYDLPDSVIGFFRGELGTPPGGWPEPFRTKALEGRDDKREEKTISESDRRALSEEASETERRDALSRLMMPGPAKEQKAAELEYGDVSVLPTRAFFYGLESGREISVDLEPGVRLYVELEATTGADERGIRTLLVSINGQTRAVDAQDRSREPEVPTREKANLSESGHVPAPMSGVVNLSCELGSEVEEGMQLGTIEAMKMESAIRAPKSGKLSRVAVESGSRVDPGDLLVVIE
ncbi:pyruvate carboxylase [Rubrobacter radiotolerans]|uniref:Pyruvate carboxylase n=1 Tax=Rubrobacter radiotolerans TaxID=42256 RepID=A0A023X645_RUBRA|nr:pyruvate carboxylase [Rubrobacter radiotolerans]AHY47470.1 pyruvate carboxylase [Rubrobacter radiotolerans]MDX5894874.1 pyruvate carboxylase [Rubrobacter radiotolerans]SMC06963.1 pyruvate carboxylase [Rubrobacter radiotolerans DSM 5868]